MNFLMKVKTGIADFFGECAARYRRYWEAENKKAVEAAKIQQHQELAVAALPQYDVLLEVLAEAINNTADATHLVPVRRRSQLENTPWLHPLKSGVWAFCFRFRYTRGFGMTAEEITRILQRELNQLLADYGLFPMRVHVYLGPDGTGVIYVAYLADLQAAQKEMI